MNKKEMGMILYIMQEQYRADNITERTVNAWLPVFESYDYHTVEMAVKMMAKEREYTSFPAPASLVKYIGIITGKSDPNALWELAHRAMGKASTFTRETFEELPEELQRFFGSINQLREYGLMDVDKIGIVKNAFFRELPVIETRLMAQREMQPLLGQLNQKQIGGE